MNTQQRIVVIGGGAVGLCAAYYLRRQGADVTIIEKNKIANACSLHNAGYVCPSHFVPLAHPGVITQGLKWMLDPESPFYIKPRLNLDLLRWIWLFRRFSTEAHVHGSMHLLHDMCHESLGLVEELEALPGVDFGLTKNGILMLFNTEKGRRGNIEEAELALKLGVEARVLDRAGLQELNPEVEFLATGAVFFPGDAHILPSAFGTAMGDELRRMGVAILSDEEVTGCVRSNGNLSAVITPKGTHAADQFILAGGSWSPVIARNLGIRLPLQPGKGYSITVTRPPRKPSIPMILTEARVAITPFTDSLRFAGTMELAGLNLSINERRVNAILKAVPRYMRGLEGTRTQGAEIWGGLRPCTPDGLPYVGRFTSVPNVIAATGHAMLGITLAAVTGSLVADIAANRTPSLDIRPLSPERFN